MKKPDHIHHFTKQKGDGKGKVPTWKCKYCTKKVKST